MNHLRFPNVCIIIVTWNKKADVLNLLSQLNHINYPKESIQIIVVDNASSDGTIPAIEQAFPSVHLVKHSENLGGAGGFNSGMRRAMEQFPDSEYLWLLDNDVTVDKNALQALVSVMEKHPKAAICGSKIMNRDNPNELIEIGAFIDDRRGDIRRNEPNPEQLKDPNAVFEVDYVAACSLLARVSAVKQAGLWHEQFFIYWDDMEWGARFNSLGFKVLATNSSIVYHPSWAGRVADNTAIWRNYYRSRNSLWFFNHYTKGFKRRWLLSRMILRYMLFAAHAGINSHMLLSLAFINGITDFFENRFGKKPFVMPPDNLPDYVQKHSIQTVVIFILDKRETVNIRRYVKTLTDQVPKLKWIGIVPTSDIHYWKNENCFTTVFGYKRHMNGRICWLEQFRMLNFLRIQQWDLVVTSKPVPRMATIWGKPVACLDSHNQKIMAIEKISIQHMMRIPMITMDFMVRMWTRNDR